MTPFDRSHTSSYWHSIVTMALSCIISEIKRDIGRKSRFLHTPLTFDAPVRESPSEYCHKVWVGKTMCDRQAEGQTDGHLATAQSALCIYTAISHCAVKAVVNRADRKGKWNKVTVDLYCASPRTCLWHATASRKSALISATQPFSQAPASHYETTDTGWCITRCCLFTPPADAGYSFQPRQAQAE